MTHQLWFLFQTKYKSPVFTKKPSKNLISHLHLKTFSVFCFVFVSHRNSNSLPYRNVLIAKVWCFYYHTDSTNPQTSKSNNKRGRLCDEGEQVQYIKKLQVFEQSKSRNRRGRRKTSVTERRRDLIQLITFCEPVIIDTKKVTLTGSSHMCIEQRDTIFISTYMIVTVFV